MENNEPLISLLICNEILIDMVSDKDRVMWANYDLHAKLKASRQCIDSKKTVRKWLRNCVVNIIKIAYNYISEN